MDNLEKAGMIFDHQHKRLQEALKTQDNPTLSKRQIKNRIKKYQKLKIINYTPESAGIRPHLEYKSHEKLIKMFLSAEETPPRGKTNEISSFYKGFCFIIDTYLNETEKEKIFLFLKQNQQKLNNNFFIIGGEDIKTHIPDLKKNETISIPIEKFLSKRPIMKKDIITQPLNNINFNDLSKNDHNSILNFAYYLKEYKIKTILFTYGSIYTSDLIKGLFYTLGPNRLGIIGKKNIEDIVKEIGEFKRLAPLRFKKKI